MLQLWRILFDRRFFREGPRQHEFRLEDGAGRFHPAVERRAHPVQGRVPDMPLHIDHLMTAIGLKPAPIKVFGHHPELDDEIAGQVLRLDLAALFPPEPKLAPHHRTHDDPGIRAANEISAPV